MGVVAMVGYVGSSFPQGLRTHVDELTAANSRSAEATASLERYGETDADPPLIALVRIRRPIDSTTSQRRIQRVVETLGQADGVGAVRSYLDIAKVKGELGTGRWRSLRRGSSPAITTSRS